MQGISKSAIPIAFGAGVAAFLGYCFWFDQKRRGAKDFKKKLHEKRQDREKKIRSKGKVTNKLPDLTDHEAVQRYFLHEIQMGEALISQGDITNGVEHLANAVIVCGQPTQLLQVLQQTLPAEVFALLITRMREFQSEVGVGGAPAAPGMLRLAEANDDLE